MNVHTWGSTTRGVGAVRPDGPPLHQLARCAEVYGHTWGSTARGVGVVPPGGPPPHQLSRCARANASACTDKCNADRDSIGARVRMYHCPPSIDTVPPASLHTTVTGWPSPQARRKLPAVASYHSLLLCPPFRNRMCPHFE